MNIMGNTKNSACQHCSFVNCIILCETFRGFFKFLEEKWSLFEKFVEDSREMTKARENWSAAQRAAKEAEEAKSRGSDADEERIIVVQGWTRRRSSIYRARRDTMFLSRPAVIVLN